MTIKVKNIATQENYHGVLLDRRETAVLKEIEDRLSSEIPLVHQIPRTGEGVVIKDGHITEISLYWTGIVDLPLDFGALKHLRLAKLKGCKIETLPDSFSRLDSLEYLDLSENLLALLPESFANLSCLIHLDLAENRLTRLPDFWGHFSNLQYLDLMNNLLETLPPSFSQLDSLIEFSFPGNSLTSLDFSVKNLQNIEGFGASSNELHSLPLDFDQLSKLKELSLASNRFSKIPIKAGQFPQLIALDLEGNEFSFIPPLAASITLHRLGLGWNRLVTLVGLAEYYPALEIFDMRANQLGDLAGFPSKLPTARKIILEGNRLERLEGLPPNLPRIEVLNIGNNPLRTLSYAPISILRAIFTEPVNYRNLALSQEGAELVATRDVEALYVYYRRTPLELARLLVNGDALTPQEERRLVYEANYDELTILLRHLPNEHPICKAIRNRIGDFLLDLIDKIEADMPLTEDDLRHPLLPRYAAILEDYCRRRHTATAKNTLALLYQVFVSPNHPEDSDNFRLVL
jgi:Leucine-rich repeat (LRR) protein